MHGHRGGQHPLEGELHHGILVHRQLLDPAGQQRGVRGGEGSGEALRNVPARGPAAGVGLRGGRNAGRSCELAQQPQRNTALANSNVETHFSSQALWSSSRAAVLLKATCTVEARPAGEEAGARARRGGEDSVGRRGDWVMMPAAAHRTAEGRGQRGRPAGLTARGSGDCAEGGAGQGHADRAQGKCLGLRCQSCRGHRSNAGSVGRDKASGAC